MKRDLKGKHFQNVEEVREKTTEALKAITLQELSGGISVLLLKESILKVNKLWKCSEKYTIFKKKILVTFGSPLVSVHCTLQNTQTDMATHDFACSGLTASDDICVFPSITLHLD
jgi:hypothetical protein